MRRGDLLWGASLAAVIALFVLPSTATFLLDFNAHHAYVMGFVKFALLATMGELLVIRLEEGDWRRPAWLWAKSLVWGMVGVFVVLMFSLFNTGVQGAGAKGLLPIGGEGWPRSLLVAFWTSFIMNLTFGPVFMAAHRISDAWIEDRSKGGRRAFGDVVAAVDWKRFLGFVVGKTIPLFWIPVHTLVFLLPSEYRILAAALLSIALGVILTWGKRAKAGLVDKSGSNVEKEAKR